VPQVAVQADQPPQLCLTQWRLMFECETERFERALEPGHVVLPPHEAPEQPRYEWR
jgi:hypothetical protein